MRFTFLFRVGLAQLFVGVALSELDEGEILVGLGRQMLRFGVFGLAQFFCLAFGVSCWALAFFVHAAAGATFC